MKLKITFFSFLFIFCCFCFPGQAIAQVCGGTYVDSGGTAANYASNELDTVTICPDVTGDVVYVTFTFVDIETSTGNGVNLTGCWDYISVYDGPDTNAPLLGDFCGELDGDGGVPSVADNLLQAGDMFISTHASGCLTFTFDSDGVITEPGWEATIMCAPPPTCATPSGLGATNVLNNSAVAFWTAAAGTSDFNVEWGVDGFALGTGTVIPVVADTSVTIMGLAAATDYEFYVQADCGVVDGTSIWIGPFPFTTLCDVFIAPYTQDFDNGGVIPNCWNNFGAELWLFADGTASEPGHGGNAGNIVDHTSGTGFFAWVNDSSPNNLGTTLESPLVDISGLSVPALIFWINSDDEGDANGNVTFKVDFWDGAAWNMAIFTSSMNTNGWLEIILDLSSFTVTGPVQARFIVDEDNGGGFDDDFALDDVSFAEGPSCFNPVGLGVTNLTSMAADLFWTSGAGETDFNVEWDTTGFTLGMGNMVPVVGDTTTNISGLTELTTYQFYVQADCGAGGTSSWIGPFSFTTPCNTFIAPYLETFDNGGVIPDCWSTFGAENWLFADGTASEPGHGGNLGNIVDHTSGTGFFAWVNDSSPNNLGTTLESPLVDISGLSAPALIFWINSDDEGDANGNVTFKVDFWDGAAWNMAIYTSSMNTNGWFEVVLDLSGFTITGPVQARFIVDEDNGTGFDDDFALDDVAFDEGPSCFSPLGLGATGITSASADLFWSSGGGETDFNVEWDTTGFILATGNMVAVAGDTTTNISGLTELTTYQFYVQADCGAGGLSDWIGPFSFTTPCNTFTAPYLETFDNGGTIPDCWATFGSETWLFADGSLSEPGHGGNAGNIVDHTSGTGYFAWVNDSSPNSLGTTLESPLVDVSGLVSPGLYFWINSDDEGDANGNVTFFVDFWDGAAWNNAIYTSSMNTSGWMEVVIDLTVYTITGPVQARFIVDEDNGSGFDDDVALDDVAFDNLPLCPAVGGLAASSITTTSADISWVSGGTNFNLEYGVGGFGQGTGTAISTMNMTESLSGLTPNTAYDVYVQNDCSGGMADMIITGVFDGPLSGGLPKAIEVYAVNPIPDLSIYGLGSANNGGGTDGEEFTFPADPAAGGSFLYLTTDSAAFHQYFGFATPYVQSDFPSAASINGDDAIELFENSVVIDVFGDINVDGNGETWEYLDGWATRVSGTVNNNGTFTDTEFTYSGVDATDGDTLNSTSGSPWPIGTYQAPVSSWVQTTFMTLCAPVLGDSLTDPIIVGSLPYMDVNSNATCYTNQYVGRVTPDVIYQFTTGPCADSIRISTCSDISDFDTYLYLLDAGGVQLAFNDDASTTLNPCPFTLNGLNRFSTIKTGVDPNTTYFAVVDGFNAAALGTFSLDIEEIEKTAPTAAASNVSCSGFNDGSIDVTPGTGTAPFTYAWSNGATTEDISGLAPGMYDATVTDTDGCVTVIPEMTITEPTPLAPDFATLVIENASCFGEADGLVMVDIIGGTMPYTYSWSNGATTAGLTGLAAGSYTGTVTDANGCIFVTPLPLTITEPDELDIPDGNDVVVNVSCHGAADGSFMVTPAGGTPPYTYAWSDGQTGTGASFTATGLAPGMYGGTITDTNGCEINNDNDLVEITQPDALLPDFTTLVISNVSCNGANDGGLQIDMMGGTTPYTFLWSNGATTEDLSGLAPDSYTGTVTDANGCVYVTPIALMITEPDPLLPDFTTLVISNVSCNGANDGGLQIDMMGGTTPYTFLWSNGATTEDLSGLAPGSYTGTVTDANSCVFVTPVALTITEPASLTSDASVVDESADGANDGTVDLTPMGGTTPYTYEWSNGATTEDLAGLADGIYFSTVTDANGCTVTGSWTVMAGPTGVNNIQMLDLFELFPNPAEYETLLNLEFSNQVDLRIELVNVLGQVLFVEQTNGILAYQHQFDLKKLAPGGYYVRLLVDGKIAVKPLVVTR